MMHYNLLLGESNNMAKIYMSNLWLQSSLIRRDRQNTGNLDVWVYESIDSCIEGANNAEQSIKYVMSDGCKLFGLQK